MLTHGCPGAVRWLLPAPSAWSREATSFYHQLESQCPDAMESNMLPCFMGFLPPNSSVFPSLCLVPFPQRRSFAPWLPYMAAVSPEHPGTTELSRRSSESLQKPHSMRDAFKGGRQEPQVHCIHTRTPHIVSFLIRASDTIP